MGVLGWRAVSITSWVTSGKSFASLSLSFHVCKTRVQRSPVGLGIQAADNRRVLWALCLLGGGSGTDAHEGLWGLHWASHGPQRAEEAELE